MKIGFIGGGNMGEAMIRGVLAAGISAPKDIRVTDISAFTTLKRARIARLRRRVPMQWCWRSSPRT